MFGTTAIVACLYTELMGRLNGWNLLDSPKRIPWQDFSKTSQVQYAKSRVYTKWRASRGAQPKGFSIPSAAKVRRGRGVAEA
jgi:hypothetical protein